MRTPTLWLIFALLVTLISVPAASMEITSVYPIKAYSGTHITITGGPFDKTTKIVLGQHLIEPTSAAEDLLTFSMPQLKEGQYALILKDQEKTFSSNFTLEVVEPKPTITSLYPANIDVCSTDTERRITIEGEYFHPEANILLDGAAIPPISQSGEQITFIVPPYSEGFHEIQIVNPNEKKSLPHSLFVNSIPEILSISQGEDFVNSYELIIEGKNFLYNSVLLVNGQRVIRSAAAPSQIASVNYVNCNTIRYIRYPYTQEPKRTSFQIINPGDKESPVFYATIP